METKQAIRKEVYKRRKEAFSEQIIQDSHQIFLALRRLPAFLQSKWIFVYMDCKNEVKTGEIMEEAWKMGKRVAAPRVEGKDMIFYEITSPDDLEPGYFGIMEPKIGQKDRKSVV